VAEILPAPPPVQLQPAAPWHLLPQLLAPAEAQALRAAIDAHFSDPYKAGDAQQVWNYWHVPGSYTYLRTAPQKVLGDALAAGFQRRMEALARLHLGMDRVTWPYLSLYVEGCVQTLHNDSRNGAFGYVYSLTNWDQRRFSGGETLVFREQDYWAGGHFRESGAGTAFYELIASRFNQLLMFDDRLIHGVPEVRGTSDPREGRLVLHGHVQISGPFADGPLADMLPELLRGALGDAQATAQHAVAAEAGRFHGFATCAVEVAASGAVTGVRPLVRRVLGRDGPQGELPVLATLHAALAQLRLPAQPQPSRIVLPLFFA
jgi:hypothetical protein